MQQNAPFCVLPRPPTAFSLSRVGMYASDRSNFNQIELLSSQEIFNLTIKLMFKKIYCDDKINQ